MLVMKDQVVKTPTSLPRKFIYNTPQMAEVLGPPFLKIGILQVPSPLHGIIGTHRTSPSRQVPKQPIPYFDGTSPLTLEMILITGGWKTWKF
jgi:hypothetical protein